MWGGRGGGFVGRGEAGGGAGEEPRLSASPEPSERTLSPRGFPALRPRGEGARATRAASARRSDRLGVHSRPPPATPGAAQSFPRGLGDRGSPSCHPPPPLRELSARRPWPKEEEEGSRRGLVWPPSPARPAPARTPSPASYFRTRKVRAAPGDSAAAPVPGSRVCSRVARRTVQTPPWLRPPPAPGSPTSISSSRSSESKRPCLASPPRDPSSPSWGQRARGPRRGDRPWLGAGGAQRGGNLCPTLAGALNPQPISSGPPPLHRRLSEFTISAVVAVILRSVRARQGECVCVCSERKGDACKVQHLSHFV